MNERERFEKEMAKMLWPDSLSLLFEREGSRLTPTAEWFAWTVWQAALSAATPNNGTYCIHGIKCALCADGISPAGTGQPLNENFNAGGENWPWAGDSVKGEGETATMKINDEQIEYMVQRFLGWRLPENFNPDAGISFKRTFNEHTDHPMKSEPTGTNLFDYGQAKEMIRYLIDGMPVASAPSPEELARDIHAQVCEGLLSHDCEPEIEAVAALLRARGERWIPVSERLPDIEPDHEGFTRFVLVVCKHYTEAVKGRYIHKLKEWRVEGSNSNMNDSVTHWRPLPAPPREGE